MNSNKPCLCEYIATTKNKTLTVQSSESSIVSSFTTQPEPEPTEKKSSITTESEEVSAKQLADAKSEIEMLKSKLAKSNVTIDNLENLVRTISLKQNELSSSMYDLVRENKELQDEECMLRNYHIMERNVLSRELSDAKKLLDERTNLLENSLQQKDELNASLLAANSKICLIGENFLELSLSRSKNRPEEPSSSANDEEESDE